MTPEARAGSTLNLFNVIGINIPAIPAINKFIIIAIAITIPNKKSSNQYEESKRGQKRSFAPIPTCNDLDERK